MIKVLFVVGARPNFMKVAPVMREMARFPEEFEQVLVHTGQHYDDNMSKLFFNDLDLPWPDINLEVGSGTHAEQTGGIMQRFEPVVIEHQPDWVIVVGDVNSTLACALVCAKLCVKVAHIEAGLRSFDRTMPEEFNRVLTDQIAGLLFTHSRDADDNLLREGISSDRIHFVGNVMIDTLVRLLPKAEERLPNLQSKLGIACEVPSVNPKSATPRSAFRVPRSYVLVTLHRPRNVDDPEKLAEIMLALSEISKEICVVFPVHPRTRRMLNSADVGDIRKLETGNPPSRGAIAPLRRAGGLKLVSPLGYLDFLSLESHASVVLTDSGGIQEETTWLGVPCLTLRPVTERPITISHGTNLLVASAREALVNAVRDVLNAERPVGDVKPPSLWDGKVSERIVRIFKSI